MNLNDRIILHSDACGLWGLCETQKIQDSSPPDFDYAGTFWITNRDKVISVLERVMENGNYIMHGKPKDHVEGGE